MTLRKVLITGGTGFLGSKLVRTFLANDIQVGILTRGNSFGHAQDISKKCHFFPYDSKGLELATADHPADLLIHAATCYGRNSESHSELLHSNFLKPLELYQTCNGRVGFWINIGTGLDSEVSPYANSKHLLGNWLRAHSQSTVPWIDLALQHFYGNGEDINKFISYVTHNCKYSEKLDLSDGNQIRDFIHIDDVVDAVNFIIENRHSFYPLSTIDVGTGVGYPIKEVVELIHKYLNSKTILNFGAIARRPKEPLKCVADISVLKSLGWQPKISIFDGLSNFTSNYST